MMIKAAFALASLAVSTLAITINVPKPNATLNAGENVTVQFLNPISTSNEAGIVELSLVVGIFGCGSSPCPSPASHLGKVFYTDKFQGQGLFTSNPPVEFQNITFTVPSDLSGSAAIQVMHVTLVSTEYDNYPSIEYVSSAVQVVSGSGSGSGSGSTVHPNGNTSKCVGISGGQYTNGAAVDIYDCNGSDTQKWQWIGDALTSINPADQSQWCLDAGVQSQWTNGVKMKIWQCFPGLAQQTWTPITTSGNIKLAADNFCLDLTNGDTTNSNVLQIWSCTQGDVNQIWSLST